MSNYAIGTADNFDVIVPGAVERVEYDLKQAQEQGYAKYEYMGKMHRTTQLNLGENISVSIANNIWHSKGSIEGFIVPDYLLYVFIREFRELTILKQ